MCCRTCDRDSTRRKPSNSNGSLGKRTASSPPTDATHLQKKPRYSDIVKNTVTTMMDSWFLEENNILSESLEEMEEGYDRMITTLNTKLRMANHTNELLVTQLQAVMRYANMIHTWCPMVEEMFPGDFDDLRAIQAAQNRHLAQWVENMEATTDTE